MHLVLSPDMQDFLAGQADAVKEAEAKVKKHVQSKPKSGWKPGLIPVTPTSDLSASPAHAQARPASEEELMQRRSRGHSLQAVRAQFLL